MCRTTLLETEPVSELSEVLRMVDDGMVGKDPGRWGMIVYKTTASCPQCNDHKKERFEWMVRYRDRHEEAPQPPCSECNTPVVFHADISARVLEGLSVFEREQGGVG